MKKFLITLTFFFLVATLQADDEFCGIRNVSFQTGEVINFNVYYSVGPVYVNAGSASFTTSMGKVNNKVVYHVTGEGHTNSKYDWIYRVRDVYETFFDTSTLKPLKFIRNVNEGGYIKKENVTFNHQSNTATSEKGTYNVPNCVQDVLSSVYYARNINFDNYKPNDKIPFSMFLDNEVYNLYLRYLGKEVVKTRYGKFKAVHFKPLLVKGTIFEGGEKMEVWVSDDQNHIPLRIESPIIVGSIKVDMMGYKNLRYKLTSQQ